jgi:hypothetical protein
MNAVDDIEKLRPELLQKSVAQLDREIVERQLAIAYIQRAEETARRAALVDEAASRVERLVDDIKWLHASGFLSAKVTESFTRADGQFNPATFIRPPRAEDVVARPKQATVDTNPVRRRRRRRDPVTGELLPSKASLGDESERAA